MKKRFLALLLTFCLVLSLCSVTAFAADENSNTGSETQAATSVASVSQTADGTETTKYYDTLAAAITNASDGATVKLLEDAFGDGIIINTSNFSTTGLTIDFSNHTYTVNTDKFAGSTGTQSQCFQLLTGGSVTMKNGKIVADNSGVAMIIQNYCDLTLDGMTLDATQGTNNVSYVLSNNCGNVTIEDTTITAKENGVAFDVYGGFGSYSDVSVTVTGDSVINGTVEVARSSSNNTNTNTLLIEDGATVNGNVSVVQGTSVTIDEATINGNVTVTDSSTAAVTILDSTVSGTVSDTATVLNSKVGNEEIDKQIPKGVVALVDGVTYTSLSDAISAAQPDDTVLLLNDTTETVVIKTNITLDLNGKKLTAANERAYAVNIGSGDANVKVTIQNGTLTGGSSCVVQMYSGNQSLTLDGVTVTSANGAGAIWDFGTNSSLTLTDCEVSGDYFAIYHNGSTAPFTLTAKGSTITAIEGSVANACAIYVSGSSTNTATTKNKIELTGCTVTGPTGIEGKYTDITLTNCTITATADVSFEQDSNGSTALGFAVVSTDNSKTPNTPAPEATITINSGTYVGLIGLGHFEEANVGTEATYVVNGGSFSESVSDYVVESLTAELISSSDTDTPYSYCTDVAAAAEVAQPGDLIVDLSKEDSEVQILGVGFNATAEGANTAMNAIIANLDGSNTVNDSDVNTMWAFLKLSDTPTTYTLTVTKDAVEVYTQELKNASGLYYVYFTFNTENGGSPAKQEIASSTYTVTLTTGADEDKVTKTAEITLAKVSFNLNNGTLVDENGNNATPAATYYAAGSTVELPTPTRSGSYRFNGWSDGSGTYTGTYTVPADGKDITLTDSWTYTGGSGGGGTTTYSITVASVSNGSVSASPTNASKGTTVTLTVSPDDGYELSSLTVTDASGNVLTLTDKGDGKYTFTMPASKVTVSATFTEIESEHNCPSKIFTDVDITRYYHEAVDWAVLNGVTNGTSATTFSPDASCTRAQMVTFLWRAAGSPAPTSTTTPFTDVESGAYYYDAVLWAVEKGITNGTSATTFSPDETVTRGQTVTFLYRYAGSPAVSGGNNFTDVPTNAYYADAVQWAVANGVTYGTSTTAFSPANNCTRAQIVTLLYRDIAK